MQRICDNSLLDTQARDVGDSMTRYTVFASAVAAEGGALLKCEVVQMLPATVFSVDGGSW